MNTIDYTITDIEHNEDGTQTMLWLTRPFGPLDAETTKDLKIGDEMSINIQFPTDIPPDSPINEAQMNMFSEQDGGA